MRKLILINVSILSAEIYNKLLFSATKISKPLFSISFTQYLRGDSSGDGEYFEEE